MCVFKNQLRLLKDKLLTFTNLSLWPVEMQSHMSKRLKLLMYYYENLLKVKYSARFIRTIISMIDTILTQRNQ